jgi:hypothetical protein
VDLELGIACRVTEPRDPGARQLADGAGLTDRALEEQFDALDPGVKYAWQPILKVCEDRLESHGACPPQLGELEGELVRQGKAAGGRLGLAARGAEPVIGEVVDVAEQQVGGVKPVSDIEVPVIQAYPPNLYPVFELVRRLH